MHGKIIPFYSLEGKWGLGDCVSRTQAVYGGRGQMTKGLELFYAQCECYLVSHRRCLSVSNRERTKSSLDLKNNSRQRVHQSTGSYSLQLSELLRGLIQTQIAGPTPKSV